MLITWNAMIWGQLQIPEPRQTFGVCQAWSAWLAMSGHKPATHDRWKILRRFGCPILNLNLSTWGFLGKSRRANPQPYFLQRSFMFWIPIHFPDVRESIILMSTLPLGSWLLIRGPTFKADPTCYPEGENSSSIYVRSFLSCIFALIHVHLHVRLSSSLNHSVLQYSTPPSKRFGEVEKVFTYKPMQCDCKLEGKCFLAPGTQKRQQSKEQRNGTIENQNAEKQNGSRT